MTTEGLHSVPAAASKRSFVNTHIALCSPNIFKQSCKQYQNTAMPRLNSLNQFSVPWRSNNTGGTNIRPMVPLGQTNNNHLFRKICGLSVPPIIVCEYARASFALALICLIWEEFKTKKYKSHRKSFTDAALDANRQRTYCCCVANCMAPFSTHTHNTIYYAGPSEFSCLPQPTLPVDSAPRFCHESSVLCWLLSRHLNA